MSKIDYIWMLEGEYVDRCSSCRSEAPLSEFSTPYGQRRCRGDKQLLCEFCATSDTANITLYEHNREYRKQAVLTAQAANFTVMKLGGFKGVKSNCPDCEGMGWLGKLGSITPLTRGQLEQLCDPTPGRIPVMRTESATICPTCKGVNL